MDILKEIERGLQKPGKSRIGLAKALGKSPSTITDMLNPSGKRRQIKAAEIPVIREYLELDNTVPIVGHVGASSEDVYYAAGDDPAEYVPAPVGGSDETVAVEIRGDSLGPGLNGWLAFYDDRHEPVTDNLMGRLCVVGLADGRVVIKVIRKARGRDRYHLFPNASGEPMMDEKVAWAAKVIHLSPKIGR